MPHLASRFPVKRRLMLRHNRHDVPRPRSLSAAEHGRSAGSSGSGGSGGSGDSELYASFSRGRFHGSNATTTSIGIRIRRIHFDMCFTLEVQREGHLTDQVYSGGGKVGVAKVHVWYHFANILQVGDPDEPACSRLDEKNRLRESPVRLMAPRPAEALSQQVTGDKQNLPRRPSIQLLLRRNSPGFLLLVDVKINAIAHRRVLSSALRVYIGCEGFLPPPNGLPGSPPPTPCYESTTTTYFYNAIRTPHHQVRNVKMNSAVVDRARGESQQLFVFI